MFDFPLTPADVARFSAPDRGDELLLDPETFGALSRAYGCTTFSSRIVTVPVLPSTRIR